MLNGVTGSGGAGGRFGLGSGSPAKFSSSGNSSVPRLVRQWWTPRRRVENDFIRAEFAQQPVDVVGAPGLQVAFVVARTRCLRRRIRRGRNAGLRAASRGVLLSSAGISSSKNTRSAARMSSSSVSSRDRSWVVGDDGRKPSGFFAVPPAGAAERGIRSPPVPWRPCVCPDRQDVRP